ncbi:Stk1 family PASTA domain-containing Ser/Thr kinase [Paraclostridium tenue]|uniref:non-specific serine/threonine protein kinase n=1 Tax=Paraclostridium tenue TaxID=1737 RepID=A0ABN1LW92_9FIRM
MGETVLGNRYEIIKKIGDGGMAFVYEARDRLLNRTVAIKVLRPEFVDDQEFLTKFKREAEAVASLSHPNIVNVYDVGEDGKVHYIVMELIEGQNLKDIIKNEGTLDEYTALDITKQIARALGAAHKKGIIHRDIKPHNILISNEGRIVKVADFGIAKAVSSSTITSTGSVIGSVHYFSPEQAKGKFVGNTTDLYSLGIVLYEMIIGRVPFRGDSPISIALQHINDEIEFTQEEKVAIPQSVRNIIKKLTSKSSADRYQGADELIEDIEYIEKNIDLDFIKEYDNYATQKIDENELNKAIKMGNTNPKIDYNEEDLEEEDEKTPPKKNSNRKKNKKEDNPKSKKRWKIAAVVLSIILIIQVLVVGKIASSMFGKNKTEEGKAPDFINMELSEAQKVAGDMGINISVRIEEYSSKVSKNHIIDQAPKAGTQINPGDTISVVVSKGEKQTSIPNLVGLTIGEAQSIISENKLTLGTVNYEYNDSHEKDVVLHQSPSSGSIQAGDKINLVVSRGPKVVEQEKPVVPETPKEPNTDNSDKNQSQTNPSNSNNGDNSSHQNNNNDGSHQNPGTSGSTEGGQIGAPSGDGGQSENPNNGDTSQSGQGTGEKPETQAHQ